MVIIDDATRKNWIRLLSCESHALAAFKHYHAMIKQSTKSTIGILKTDRVGEFTSAEFSKYLLEHGIQREMGPPDSPQQNSVVKRFNRTLADKLCSILIHRNLPACLWGEVILSVSHILNLCPSKAIQHSCPEAAWQEMALKLRKSRS